MGIEKKRGALWAEIQRVIATLCSPSVLRTFRVLSLTLCFVLFYFFPIHNLMFQIENFLAVLDRMQSFAEFGEEFSGEPALKLSYSLLSMLSLSLI